MSSDVDRPGNSERGRSEEGTREAGPGAVPRRAQRAAPGSASGCRYAIRVEGLLDDHWSQWLEGVTITHEEGGITCLEGVVIDQAALHGLLNKLRDLRLPIVTVQRLEAGTEQRKGDKGAPLSEEPPESIA